MMLDLFWFLAGVMVAVVVVLVIGRYVLRRQRLNLIQAERRAADSERLAEIGRMTSGLAHEIKNPLSTISLNAQLLEEDLNEVGIDEADAGRMRRRFASLRREIDRLSGILTDFLQFAGRIHLDPEPHDLNVVIEELVDFFLPQAQQAEVRLFTSPSSEPATVHIDSALLKQAVLNLMINAVHALESNTDSDSPRQLMLRVEHEKKPVPSVVLHVTDTGPGINPDRLREIFQPYYSMKKGGTGLGLPTARRIVQEHGGQIDVLTEPGQGTDFIIHLPTRDR